MAEFRHVPVLLEPVLEQLRIRPDGIYVDGTLGGGGHSAEIVKRLTEGGRLIGIDRDEAAIEAAGARLAPSGDRITVVRANYGEIRRVLDDLCIDRVDGILLDLGVSSYQLDTADRGFSYMADAPLDMRMDQEESRTAADLVNGCSEDELTRILRDYGEERYARNIARHIVAARAEKPVETTGELVRIVQASIPMKMQRTGGHPAKRTFQALRIELNQELTVLEDVTDTMIDCLNPGGRLCVITFHSLEDRIIKNRFRTAENPCVCPKNFPVCICGRKSRGRVVTRKPILPTEEETASNSRAKSAKLRVFERA
ncbi:MAG: 16S rRNA (cytosine(1402)-N(4))-methyltransferase RsmH [Lachnospiraceae bacterium]|nr:16S rRNA (cytosine(1402)-N(4))-methyltransferase RsmH [Lachnospiraceae bacterium]